MKKYTRPEFDIRLFSCEAVVTTVSGVNPNGYTNALTEWQQQNNAELTKAKITELQNVIKFTF